MTTHHPHSEKENEQAAAAENGENNAQAETPKKSDEPQSAPAPEKAVENASALLQTQLDQWKSKYAYLLADFDTYRRRAGKDIAQARIEGTLSAMMPMVELSDHFTRAVEASTKTDNVEKIREGLQLIAQQMAKMLQSAGLKAVPGVGAPFDPLVHEALSTIASDQPEGTILEVWSTGYTYGERLIRPSKVVVSAGPAKTNKEA